MVWLVVGPQVARSRWQTIVGGGDARYQRALKWTSHSGVCHQGEDRAPTPDISGRPASSRACLMVEPLPLEVPNRSWGTETSLNPYVTTFYMCSVRPRTLSEADVVGSPSRAPTTSGTRFQIYFRTLRGRGTCCGCSRIAGCPRTSPLFRHSSTPSSRIATSSDHQADRERT